MANNADNPQGTKDPLIVRLETEARLKAEEYVREVQKGRFGRKQQREASKNPNQYTEITFDRYKKRAYDDLIQKRPEVAERNRNNPDIVEALNRTKTRLVENIDESTNLEDYQRITQGQAFQGEMQIIKDRRLDHYKRLYGRKVKDEEDREIYRLGNKETIFFKDPSKVLNAYEIEFYKRFGGRAGLPKFQGVTANGYQIESIEGRTLKSLVDEAYQKHGKDSRRYRRDVRKILDKKQGQQMLDLMAEYQNNFGLSHGYNLNNIIITPDGDVRLKYSGIDARPVEVDTAHQHLKEDFGIRGLKKPRTISTRQSQKKYRNFISEVERSLNIDLEDETRFIQYKTDTTSLATNTSQNFFIRPIQPEAVGPTPPSGPIQGAQPAAKPASPAKSGSIGKGLLKKGTKMISSKIGAAVGTSILPVVGTAIGNFIGKTVGGFINDPIGTTKRLIKGALIAAGVLVAGLTSLAVLVVIEIIIGLIAFIIFVVMIIFIINSGAYLVPPGGSYGDVPKGVTESQYIGIEKTANPRCRNRTGAGCVPGFPDVTYSVRIWAKQETLSNINITNSYTVVSPNNPPVPNPQVDEINNPPSTIQPGQDYVFNYVLPLGSEYDDSIVTDILTVTATVPSSPNEVASQLESVVTGYPPIDCPLPNGTIGWGSYIPGNETDALHGNNRYWGTVSCNSWRLPQGVNECWGPSNPAASSNKCYNNPNGTCPVYGYAIDVTGTTQVFAPTVVGSNQTWNCNYAFSNGATGHSFRCTSGEYTMMLTHMEEYLINGQQSGTFDSGEQIGNLYIHYNAQGEDITHLHMEFAINGQYIQPENYFCSVP
jgi:hypothetical protein